MGAVTIVGYLAIGRMVRGWMPLFLYAFPVTLISAVVLTLWATITEDLTFNFDEISGAFGWISVTWIFYVGYLALGPGLFGHTGINAVLRWIPPLTISMILIFGACYWFNYWMDCWCRFYPTEVDNNWRITDDIWISISYIWV